ATEDVLESGSHGSAPGRRRERNQWDEASRTAVERRITRVWARFWSLDDRRLDSWIQGGRRPSAGSGGRPRRAGEFGDRRRPRQSRRTAAEERRHLPGP